MQKIPFFKSANYDDPDANVDVFTLIENNSKVLDVGCSSGKLAERLKKEKNCFVVGIERDSDLASKAQARCDKLVKADISQLKELPFSQNYFDCIVFADILEHIVNPDEVLLKLRGYLADEGYIVLSVPNIANWEIRLRLLFGNFNYGHPLIDGGHLRFFTLSSIRRLLNDSGFRIVYLANRNARIKWLGRIWKSLFAFQFIIKAERIN